MGKLSAILILCSMAMPLAQGIAEGPQAVEEWFKQLGGGEKEKVTKLRFFFHDIRGGKNPTSMQVAQANITKTSPTFFGSVNMIDNALTVEPNLSSKVLGRAQGLYGLAGLEELSLLMTLNLVFTDGKYNGSTLALQGSNPVSHRYREISVVGGSGAFRLARGIATVNTISFDTTTGDAVVEYNVIVLHY